MAWFRRNERRFIEEVLLRMERSERRTAAVQHEMIEEIREHRREFRDHRLEFRAEAREAREEYRAHRESLMAILDQLKRLTPPPADA